MMLVISYLHAWSLLYNVALYDVCLNNSNGELMYIM